MENSDVMKALNEIGIMENSDVMKALNEMIDLTLEACKKDFMTKDGYGTMMYVVDKFKANPVVQKNFVLLCISKGYPKETGFEVIKIMGL